MYTSSSKEGKETPINPIDPVDDWEYEWKKIQAECSQIQKKREPLPYEAIVNIFAFCLVFSGVFFWSLVWLVCQWWWRWDLEQLTPAPAILTFAFGITFFASLRSLGEAFYDAIHSKK